MKNPSLSFDDLKSDISKFFSFKFEGDFKKDRTVLTKDEIARLKASFDKNLKGQKPDTKKAENFTNALITVLDNKAAVAWTSNAHTALPVSTTAIGAQSEAFNGTIDNTDIAKMLKQAVK